MKKNSLLMLCIVLVAINLRSPLSVVGPVVGRIIDDYSIREGAAGIITTLPVFLFSLGAITAKALGKKMNMHSVMLCGLLILLSGICVRVLPGLAFLYLGSSLVGIGISVIFVVLPALVRQCFPERVGFVTGLYLCMLSLSSSLGAGFSVQLSNALPGNWRGSLSVWAIPVIFAVLFWSFNKKAVPASLKLPGNDSGVSFLKNKKAWTLTLYFGFQAMPFYILISWLPMILRYKGFGEMECGLITSLSQFSGIPASLLIPSLFQKFKNKKVFSWIVVLIYLFALLLFTFDNSYGATIATVVVCSLCSSAYFAIGTFLISHRVQASENSFSLSSMVQGFGYVIASLGPFFLGKLFEIANSAVLAGAAMAFITVIILFLIGPASDESYID